MQRRCKYCGMRLRQDEVDFCNDVCRDQCHVATRDSMEEVEVFLAEAIDALSDEPAGAK